METELLPAVQEPGPRDAMVDPVLLRGPTVRRHQEGRRNDRGSSRESGVSRLHGLDERSHRPELYRELK